MKPRLRYARKVWSCTLPDWWTTGIMGLGYTPLESYNEWLAELAKRA